MNLLVMILALTSFLQGGQEQKSCDNHPKQLLDKQSRPVRLSVNDTLKRVRHCLSPALSPGVCAQGTVLVKVLIDPAGKVECAVALSGHTVLNNAALNAVKKWTFKPFKVDGQSVAVYGIVPVWISWRPAKDEKKCGQ
jgi:TonB family protein